MKLDRRHMIASVILLVGSVIYNIWVFTRSSTTVTRNSEVVDASFEGTAPPLLAAPRASPTGGTALPDVAIDRLPTWPRDPFTDLQAPPEVVAVAAPPAPEPDPVVASILYSEARRFATINGRITRIGDQIGSYTLVDILPNAVVIESPLRGRRTLPLGTLGGTAGGAVAPQ